MKPRDLFNIIIKVFGLFLVKDILLTLTYLISPIISIIKGENYKDNIETIIFSLLILGFYFYVAFRLIFRTKSISNLFKLEQDFADENLNLDVSSKNIVSVALVILGGYVLIDQIPVFCSNAFNYYELRLQTRFGGPSPSISSMVVSGVKILIAFLIVGERKRIIQLALKDQVLRQNE